jgi:hypothetical protein
MPNLIYQMPDFPKLNSDFCKGLAKHLMDDIFPYWRDTRQPLDRQWMENDRAYLCAQRLPQMEGMQYIDASRYGGTEIFNGVNNLSTRLSLASMPKDESWLTPLGRGGESAQLINAVQAQQIWTHRRSGTRKMFGRNYKQLIVRGTSYIYCRWHKEIKYRTLGTVEGRRRLRQHFKTTGQDPEIIKQISTVRVPTVEFEGPVPRILDSYDVWMDPEADLLCDRRPGMIFVTAYRPGDLKSATDDSGDPMFSNHGLDVAEGKQGRIGAIKASEFYWGSLEGTRRLESLRLLGLSIGSNMSNSADIIPVYTFYFHYLKHENVEFYDTFFHVAKSSDGNHRLIKIEENPSKEGHRLILQDQFTEFFTNVAYGISGVEKLLSAWHRKNFLDAVMLNAQSASAFPAMMIASGIFKDDQPYLTPGAINEIAMTALQSGSVIMPMPTPDRGVQLSFENMDYYSKLIGAGFENSGAYGSDMGNAKSTRETATSVNYRATSQGIAVDELCEKFGDTLQSYCQWVYDMNQQMATPEDQGREGRGDPGYIKFGQIVGNSLQPGELRFDEWRQPRSIEILGLHGITNKQQGIQNKKDFLDTLMRNAGSMPNVPAIATKVMKSLATDQNIEIDEIDWMTPQQLAMTDPATQMMAIEAGLQNPELIQMVIAKVNGQVPGQPGQPGQPAGVPPNGANNTQNQGYQPPTGAAPPPNQ